MTLYKFLSNVTVTACGAQGRRCRLSREGGGVVAMQGFRSNMVCMLMVAWSVLLFISCNQKDLAYHEEMCKVDVRFIWDKAPGASPEGMTLLFYPLESDGEFWRFEVSGRDGGAIEIPWGKYTMIALNNDLPGVMLKDMPFTSASLSVRDMPRNESYASPTGMVYEGERENLNILPGGGETVVECHPDSISTVYNIIIDGINGIERVKDIQAIFSGCADGILLSTLAPSRKPVTARFPLEIDYGQQLTTGSTTGFPSGPSAAAYMLTLRAVYPGGGAYEKVFDVTDQVVNSFYPHNVYISIKGLDLPEEPTIAPDEVGMKVDVDGWKVIEISIVTQN